jgi:archaemetzincin
MKTFGLAVLSVVVATSTLAAFAPRNTEERKEALGDIKSLPPALRRLLVEDADFDLIPLPQPGDWLSVHSEPGQSFNAFRSASPNRPDERRRTLYLLPLGEFPRGSSPALLTLQAYAEAFFQLPVKVLPAYLAADREFQPRVNPGTKQIQILTGSVLSLLRNRLPTDAYCLLGITMEDLYPDPAWNFVFGQASLSTRVGVYSFARYDPEFLGGERPDNYRSLLLLRSCKVLTHETAHMFGLQHCVYYDCVLNGANHLTEADTRTVHLCPICLRKLQDSIGFDAVRRYSDLAKFYRKEGLLKEAEWCERQVAKAAVP